MCRDLIQSGFPIRNVFIGLLTRWGFTLVFSALNIRAVSRAASQVVDEVRKQFRIPGVFEGTVKPDYAKLWVFQHDLLKKNWSRLLYWQSLFPYCGYGFTGRGFGRISCWCYS